VKNEQLDDTQQCPLARASMLTHFEIGREGGREGEALIEVLGKERKVNKREKNCTKN